MRVHEVFLSCACLVSSGSFWLSLVLTFSPEVHLRLVNLSTGDSRGCRPLHLLLVILSNTHPDARFGWLDSRWVTRAAVNRDRGL